MAKIDAMGKGIKEHLKSFRSLVPNYAKGTAKLFLASGKEYFKTNMPFPGSMIETNQELLDASAAFILNPSEAISRRVDGIFQSENVSALRKFTANALEDLRTGNLYDENRSRSGFDSDMGDMDSFGDFDMSGFDDSGEWSEPDGDHTSDVNVKIAEAQETTANARTTATISAIGEAGGAVIANQNANAQVSMRASLKQHAQSMAAMQNLITNQTAQFNLMNQSINAQLDVARETHKQLMTELGEMKGLLAEIRDGVAPPKKPERKQKEVVDLFGSDGALNIKEYFKRVVKNVDEKMGISSTAGMLTMGMSPAQLLEMVSDNPLKLVTDFMLDRMIPETTKKQMQKTSKNLSSFIPALLQSFSNRGAMFKAGQSEKIGDAVLGLLGVTPDSKTTVNFQRPDMMSKGVFTNKTAVAIEEVIPSLLAKQNSILSGEPMMVYNYSTSKFVRATGAVAETARNANELVNRAGGSVSDFLSMADNFKFKNSKERDDFKDFVYKFLHKNIEDSRLITPNMTEADFNTIMGGTGNKQYYQLISAMTQVMQREGLLEMSSNMRTAREDRNRNNGTVSSKLLDSGLGSAYSGLIDDRFVKKISERSYGRQALTDDDIAKLEREFRKTNPNTPGNTNLLLTEILSTLRTGIITYSYNLGKTTGRGSSKLPSDIEDAIRTADSNRLTEQRALKSRFEDTHKSTIRTTERTASENKTSAAEEATAILDITSSYVTGDIDVETAKQMLAAKIAGEVDAKIDDNPETRAYRKIRDKSMSAFDKIKDKVSTGKFSDIMDSVKGFISNPMSIFETGLKYMDGFMMKTIFGVDADMGDGVGANLFKTIQDTVNVNLKNAMEWFSTNVGKPLQDFLLDKEKGLFPKLKNALAEVFGLDKLKDKLVGKAKGGLGKLDSKIRGVRGEDGIWSGGFFSGTLNKLGKNNENVKGAVMDGIGKVLYGDYADTGRKGVGINKDGKMAYGGVLGKLKQGFDGFNTLLFGTDPDSDSRKQYNNIKGELGKALPDMTIGAGAGVLASFVLPGGPLLGAMIGATGGLIKGSDKFSNFLFGEFAEELQYDKNGEIVLDKDGKPKTKRTQTKEGLISAEFADGFKKYAPNITKGSIIGALAGGMGLLPFGMGQTMGMLFGGITGMAASSDTIKEMIFGKPNDEKSGLISKDFRRQAVEQIKKYAPSTISGAAIGGLFGSALGLIPGLSLLPGGPIFALLGAMTGMSNADAFNNMLFGKEVEQETTDENGVTTKEKIRKGGIFGSAVGFVRDKMLSPFAKRIDNMGTAIGGWFKDSIIGPLSRTMDPLKEEMGKAGNRIFEAFKNIGDTITTSLSNVFEKSVGEPLGDFFKNKVIEPLNKAANSIFSIIGKVLGGIISAPFKMLEYMVRGRVGDDNDLDSKAVSSDSSSGKFKGTVASAWSSFKDMIFGGDPTQASGGFYNMTGAGVPSSTSPGSGATTSSKGKGRIRTWWDSIMSKGANPTNKSSSSGKNISPLALSTVEASSTKDTSDSQIDDTAVAPVNVKNDKLVEDKKNEEANRKKTTLGKGKTSVDYLKIISRNIRRIYEEIQGQVNGVGWNTAYIKTLLERQYGGLSDSELPEEMEGSKKNIKKKRTIFGKIGDMFGRAKDATANFFGGVKERIEAVIGVVLSPFKIIGKVVSGAVNAVKMFGKGVGEVGKVLFTGAKEILGGAFKGIGEILLGGGKMIGNTLSGLGTAIGNLAASVTEIGHTLLSVVGNTIRGLVSTIATVLPDVAGMLWSGLKGFGKGVWGATKFVAKTAWKGIKGIGKGIATGAKKLFAPKDTATTKNVVHTHRTEITGGYLDDIRDGTLLKVGTPKDPEWLSVAKVFGGKLLNRPTRALPVYLLGVHKNVLKYASGNDTSSPVGGLVDNDTVNSMNEGILTNTKLPTMLLRLGSNKKSKPMPYVTVINGKSMTLETTAIPVYISGLSEAASKKMKRTPDMKKFKRLYRRTDQMAENGGNPTEAYDMAIRNAEDYSDIEAIETAQQLNGGTSGKGSSTGTTSSDGGSWLTDMLTMFTNPAGGIASMLGNAATALFGGGMLGRLASGAKGLMGGLGSALGLAASSFGLPMLGTVVNDLTGGTDDRGAVNLVKGANRLVKNAFTKPKYATTIANTAGSIGSRLLGTVDDIPTGKPATGLVNTLKNGITRIATSAMNNATVKRFLGSNGVKKISAMLDAFKKKLGTTLVNLSTDVLAKFASKLNVVVTIATTVYDIVSGAADASTVFLVPVSSVTWGMRIAAGVAKGLSGAAFGFIPVTWLAEVIYALFADEEAEEELAIAQTQLKEDAIAAGYGDDVQQYDQDHNKSTWDRVAEAITTPMSQSMNQKFTEEDIGHGSVTITAPDGGTIDAAIGPNGEMPKFEEIPGSANRTGVASYRVVYRDSAGNEVDSTSWGKGRRAFGRGRMPKYRQGSSKWAKGNDMALTGCGPTVAAMVAGAYGRSGNPSEADSMSRMMPGMRSSDGGTNPDFFKSYAATKGFGMERGPATSGMISGNLNKGRPVVLMGKGGVFGSNDHYLVADRALGKGNVSVTDPYTGASKSATMDSLLRNTNTSIYSYGKGPIEFSTNTEKSSDNYGGTVGKLQQSLVDKLNSVYGKLRYSLEWNQQNPDNGVASCASTTGWAYNKVLGVTGMSAGSSTQSKDSRFTDVYVNNGNAIDFSKLQPGDIVYQNWDQTRYNSSLEYPMQHTEMYIGDKKTLSHGGNPALGPTVKDMNDYRQSHTMKVRRYKGFMIPGSITINPDGTVTTADGIGSMDVPASSGGISGLFGSMGTDITSKIAGLAPGMAALTGISELFGTIGSKYDAVLSSLLGVPTSVEEDADASMDTGTVTDNAGFTTTQMSDLIGKDIKAKIYNYFKSKGMNNIGIAGLMGGLQTESGLQSNNLQNTFEGSLGSDGLYTDKVNMGAYNRDQFIGDGAGYGLAQWTYYSRKGDLYDMAKERNVGIEQLPMQLDLLWKELNTLYQGYNVANALNSASSVREASDLFVQKFERPTLMNDPAALDKYAAASQDMYSQMGSWGTGPSTNLTNMNSKVRSINNNIRSAQEYAEAESTASEITNRIATAVESASISGGTDNTVLKVLTESLGVMIELLSSIKDNTTPKTNTQSTTTTKSTAAVKPNLPDTTSESISSGKNVGSSVIDKLTRK